MPTPTWLPTPEQVAERIARFLPDTIGVIDGTWSDDASPTRAQVATIIRSVALSVQAAAGANLTDDLFDVAADAVAYRAAARVVASFFPEADLDYVKLLESWADEALASIQLGVTADGGEIAEVEFVDVIEFRPAGSPELAEQPTSWWG